MFKKTVIFIFFLVFNLYSDIQAKTDVTQAIKPIIILDAGHGGLDRGAKIKYPFVEEKRLTLSVVLQTKNFLERLGYKVYLTREKDYFVPLKKRVDIANDLNANLFISIHFNSCPNALVNGVEIYFFDSNENKSKTKLSKNLANSVLIDFQKNTLAYSRGVRKGDFLVIRDTKMPSILIEVGFLTNPDERDKIRKKVYLEKASLGIAEGIDNFLKKNMVHQSYSLLL